MDENWCALFVLIVKGCSMEKSFLLLSEKKQRKKKVKIKFTHEELEEIVRLKRSKTNKEIGFLFGVSDATIYRAIKRHKAGVEH